MLNKNNKKKIQRCRSASSYSSRLKIFFVQKRFFKAFINESRTDPKEIPTTDLSLTQHLLWSSRNLLNFYNFIHQSESKSEWVNRFEFILTVKHWKPLQYRFWNEILQVNKHKYSKNLHFGFVHNNLLNPNHKVWNCYCHDKFRLPSTLECNRYRIWYIHVLDKQLHDFHKMFQHTKVDTKDYCPLEL